MCYRCDVCNTVSQPGEPRKTYAVKRDDGSILREILVCKGCHTTLTEGVPLSQLVKQGGVPIRTYKESPQLDYPTRRESVNNDSPKPKREKKVQSKQPAPPVVVMGEDITTVVPPELVRKKNHPTPNGRKAGKGVVEKVK